LPSVLIIWANIKVRFWIQQSQLQLSNPSLASVAEALLSFTGSIKKQAPESLSLEFFSTFLAYQCTSNPKVPPSFFAPFSEYCPLNCP
jgi:hypothetical protein